MYYFNTRWYTTRNTNKSSGQSSESKNSAQWIGKASRHLCRVLHAPCVPASQISSKLNGPFQRMAKVKKGDEKEERFVVNPPEGPYLRDVQRKNELSRTEDKIPCRRCYKLGSLVSQRAMKKLVRKAPTRKSSQERRHRQKKATRDNR